MTLEALLVVPVLLFAFFGLFHFARLAHQRSCLNFELARLASQALHGRAQSGAAPSDCGSGSLRWTKQNESLQSSAQILRGPRVIRELRR